MTILAALLLVAVVAALWRYDRRTRPEHGLQRAIAALAVMLLFVPVGLSYGEWAYMAVRCLRQPVAISDFAAAHSYLLPSDPAYRRDSILDDYICSESEANARDYQHNTL